jgi:transposase InsO family protein
MKGRYGRSMQIYGSALPGAALLGRLGGEEPSQEGRRRWKVVQWCWDHQKKVRLTARHFGLSPDTVSRWLRAYRQQGLAGLEPHSRRPQHVRQPTTSAAVVLRIQQLREQYPRWGREKLRVLLAREGITVSAKTIDRVLHRLKARGALREPLRAARPAPVRRPALRRPRDLVVDHPGALVQIDSKQWSLPGCRPLYEFGAIDYFTRKRVVALSPSLKSCQAAAFLERLLESFPFAVLTLQSDNGSEFLGDFGPAVRKLQLTHYFNRPNYPQGNGRIERAFRTDEDEFLQVYDLPKTLSQLEDALLAWNHTYETVRPHQALGYKTPHQFYLDWLAQQPSARKETLSDMS